MTHDHYSDHMYRRVTATEAKAHLLALLDEAESGQQIEITRHGRTVARIVPARGAHAIEGSMVGIAWTADPDDELFSTGAVWDIESE
jgi:prevent-host-death family protein